MNITKPSLLLAYLITLVVFLAIDMVWLGLVAKGLYRRQLGALLSDNVNWTAAVIFYMLYIIGIFIFCIVPAVEKGSIAKALVLGGLFGFFCYATYDLTNLATLKGWPSTIVYIDIVWGVVLTAATSLSGYLVVNWLRS
ncbi:MAG TPA: DUF2177 family protein [Phnomibacter sp.]|nr:DUF2177 family protein [Phnomibacter sp.]